MDPLNKLFKIALLIGAAAAAGGCASAGTSFTTVDHPRSQSLALRVRNYNWQDVRIYFVPELGGRPIRLATVGSISTTTIPLRGQIASGVTTRGVARFVVRPLGSRESVTTDQLLVSAGGTMQLTVENRLRQSTLILVSR